MSCYHPLAGKYYGQLTENGKPKYWIGDKYTPDLAEKLPGSVPIPCGRCVGCRLEYSRTWADRMMLELETSKKAIFVTLTYDNEHAIFVDTNYDDVPAQFATLSKRDFQLFMKRLRKEFSDVRIRFYASGEYGDNTFRPHYHAIIFGLSLADFTDLKEHGRSEIGDRYFISDRLSRIWSNGFVLVSDVSWKTCAYVARYVMKKVNKFGSDAYDKIGVLPEFSLMSRRPGIGADYLSSHPDILELANINISTPEGGRKISIPKYYLKQLEVDDPEKYAKIKEDRARFSQDRMLLKLAKTDLSYIEYLEVEENKKLQKTKVLKRSSV